MLLTKRVSSSQIVSRLLILLHNPILEEDGYLTQCLCNFFNFFAAQVSGSQTMLEEAFLPTLQTIENSPDLSPLQSIDSLKVVEMIMALTRSDVPQLETEPKTMHNDLALTILNDIANEESKIPLEVLIKSLKYLDVQIESEGIKNDLMSAIKKAEKQV